MSYVNCSPNGLGVRLAASVQHSCVYIHRTQSTLKGMGLERALNGMGPERALKGMGPERALKRMGPKRVL